MAPYARMLLQYMHASVAARRRDFHSRVLTEARALPGVTSASYISFLPLVFGAGIFRVRI